MRIVHEIEGDDIQVNGGGSPYRVCEGKAKKARGRMELLLVCVSDDLEERECIYLEGDSKLLKKLFQRGLGLIESFEEFWVERDKCEPVDDLPIGHQEGLE